MDGFKTAEVVKWKGISCIIVAKEEFFKKFHPNEYWIRFEGWLPVAFRVPAKELTKTTHSYKKEFLEENNA